MNKILLFTCLIISNIFVLGQAPPNGFNYSAVARDANGNLVTDQAISLRMSIIAGSAVGTTVYQEVHSSNTDDYGMFNLTIGTGAIIYPGTKKNPLIIGKNSKVAAGSVVTKNIAKNSSVIGSPAKLLTRGLLRNLKNND